MDMSATVASFNTGTYAGTRTVTASYGTDGYSQPGSQSAISVPGCVVPMGGRDLQNLPEGMRTKQLLYIFCNQELKTAGSGFEADVLTVDGAAWQVTSVEPWAIVGNYWRCLLMRVGN